MWIDGEAPDGLGRTGFRPPHLSPAEQHPLLTGQPVDDRGGPATQGQPIRQQCDRQATEVADVLAHRERPLNVRRIITPGEIAGYEVVVLGDQRGGALGELGAVGVGPPVGQVTVAVVFGTLIVEAVPDLMADDRADPAVVGGVIGVGVEERRLQNRRGEHDLVHARVVVRIDGLRAHEPFIAVHRSAQFGQLPVELQLRTAEDVAVQIIRVDHQIRVVPPPHRVADLRGELVQLLQRPQSGLRGHPLQIADADPVGLPEVGDQFVHPGLGLRREVPVDVQSADGVSHQALHQRHPALPALPGLLGSAQNPPVEVEVLGHQGGGQHRRPGMDQPPPRPVPPVRDIRTGPQFSERGEVIRLAHNDFGESMRRAAQRGHPPGPVESGCRIGQIGERAQVVGRLGVATAHHIPVRRGQPGLQGDDAAGPFGVLVG